MSTLVAHWLDPTSLLARCSRCSLLCHLRACEAHPAFEGLHHLATEEQPLALWRPVALADSNEMVMEFLTSMGRVQTSVVDDVRWLTGEAPLLLPLGARRRRHPER